MPKADAAEPIEQAPESQHDDLGFYTLEDETEYLNVLFYGREGSGKTTDALDMANLGRILVINVEGGAKKTALAKRGINTRNVELWPRLGTRVTFDAIVNLYEKLRNDLEDDPNSWTGVVIDSATELSTILRENATSNRQKNLTSLGRDFDPNLIDRSDYGVQTDQAGRIMRRFRDLPCHFVVTALERYDEDLDMVGPAMNPALASNVLGYVDLVLYTKANQADSPDGPEFRAATRASARWRAKDRFDSTPHVLAEPTFTRLKAYVDGTLTEEDDALQEEFAERQAEKAARAEAEKEAKREARAARKRDAK